MRQDPGQFFNKHNKPKFVKYKYSVKYLEPMQLWRESKLQTTYMPSKLTWK